MTSENLLLIFNVETNEISYRDFTPEELAQAEIDEIASNEAKEKEAAKLAEKNAILEKLGLTEDEAKLLLS